MNEEEKQAIKDIEKTIQFYNKKPERIISVTVDNFDVDILKTVLNLITKLQKENEEKDKQIEKYLNKRIADVEKCYNEMLTDIGGIKIINITGLNKKEKEEVINKRNCLLVQKHCYQEILEQLAK